MQAELNDDNNVGSPNELAQQRKAIEEEKVERNAIEEEKQPFKKIKRRVDGLEDFDDQNVAIMRELGLVKE